MTQAINHHGNSKANQTARRQVICATRIEVYLCGLHDIFRWGSNDEGHRVYVAARVAEDDTDFPSRHEKLWSINSQTYGTHYSDSRRIVYEHRISRMDEQG